jgi:hypothetical protein
MCSSALESESQAVLRNEKESPGWECARIPQRVHKDMCWELQVVCELPALQTAEGAALWGQLLSGLLKVLEQRKLEQENGVGDVPDNLEDLAEENQVIIFRPVLTIYGCNCCRMHQKAEFTCIHRLHDMYVFPCAQGYAASFAQLHNAAPVEHDPVSDVPNAKANLAASLSKLSQVTL